MVAKHTTKFIVADMELQEIIKVLESHEKVQVLHGIDAYTLPLLLRIEQKPKVVKQIINQETVALFHGLTGPLVKDVIAKRVELGISMKNLLTYRNPVNEIEKSNPATLKETRMLPASFEFDLILAIFDDYVAVTKLNTEDCFGYILKDAVVAKSFEMIFDSLWEMSTKA